MMFHPADGHDWIGVGLDGGLAQYVAFLSPEYIGPPVPGMVSRVRIWVASGFHVRVVTARVSSKLSPIARGVGLAAVERWCDQHVGIVLPVTAEIDPGMIELWHPRAVGVVPNTGQVDTG